MIPLAILTQYRLVQALFAATVPDLDARPEVPTREWWTTANPEARQRWMDATRAGKKLVEMIAQRVFNPGRYEGEAMVRVEEEGRTP